MIIKKGIAKLNKVSVGSTYTQTIDGTIEIYEKVEGNYTEVIAKILSLSDNFSLTETGEQLNGSTRSDDDFRIYPNCTVDEYLNTVNSGYNADITWQEALTQIS